MTKTIYIVREFNVIDQSDLTDPVTIWACVGNIDDYSTAGTKVAGPVPLPLGERIIEGLSALLHQLGCEVVVDTTADD
jgi:hypothetical protein